MKQLDLKELIETADNICKDLYLANIGNIQSDSMTLKDKLHYELLRFAVYLADADDDMNDREIEIIHQYLKITATKQDMKSLKQKERIDSGFAQDIPKCLKYVVLADAAKKLVPDPYQGQKAMVFYDTFKLFGQTLLAVQTQEADEVASSLFTQYMKRMENFIKEFAVWYVGEQKLFPPIEPVIEGGESEEEKARKLEKLLEEMNSLIGLAGVKHQVNSLVNLIRVQKMRQALGIKVSDVSKHMVFSGNPGTGKTTVARMLANIYKYMGVLSKGHLVEVDRSGLVKGFIGQTATQVQEVVEKSLGGILFIDEAYTLTVNKGQGDFGQEAVDTLLKAMEDHRSEFIVIVAGYTDLMEQFLSSNPGLKSRFSNFIYFEDYSADELMEILRKNLASQEYVLSQEADEKAYEMLVKRVSNKPVNFANARDVRNFMEHAIANQASRIVGISEVEQNKDMLTTIEVQDLQDFS